MVDFPTRQDSVLDLVLVNHTNIISCVHPVDNLPGTDHEAIYQHSKKLLVICTTTVRLILTYFVIHCIICPGGVSLMVMLRRPGRCERTCSLVQLMLLFLEYTGGDLN